MHDLKSRTLHALSWSFVESAGLQAVQLVIGIILARLLLPEQFGLIAMLTIFMAVAQSFLDSGFGSALIPEAGRHPDRLLLDLLLQYTCGGNRRRPFVPGRTVDCSVLRPAAADAACPRAFPEHHH